MDTPLYIGNPQDGTDTYTKMRIYYSDDSYVAVQSTIDIDITTRTRLSAGYTLTVDTAGSTSRSYKVDFYNPTTGQYSSKSDAISTGSSAVIGAVQILLDDTGASVFDVSELRVFEKDAVQALAPRLLKPFIDTSLDIEEDTIDYELPTGTYQIDRLYKGAVADNTWEEVTDFEIVADRILRLPDNQVNEVLDLTIYGKRRYRNSGEVEPVIQSVLIYEVLASCYERLANERGVKFKAYQALRKDTDMRPEQFKNLAEGARRTAEIKRSEIERG